MIDLGPIKNYLSLVCTADDAGITYDKLLNALTISQMLSYKESYVRVLRLSKDMLSPDGNRVISKRNLVKLEKQLSAKFYLMQHAGNRKYYVSKDGCGFLMVDAGEYLSIVGAELWFSNLPGGSGTDAIKSALSLSRLEARPTACVHMLVAQGGILTARPVFIKESKFVVSNYSSTVRNKWAHAVSAMCSAEPPARLTILNGPPGTGKTHLIKSLLSNKDVSCLFIPNGLFPKLADPSFIGAVTDFCRSTDLPVLIMEDADDVLSSREEAGTVNPLATLLNMTDGILGVMLNIRVILTTNRKDQSLDKALIREGRLLEHIEVGYLSPSEAVECAKGLGASIKKPSNSMPLCDVYAAIKQKI